MRLPIGWTLAAGTILAAAVIAQTPDSEAGERAAVKRIYDRVQGRKASQTGPYKVTIPNTTVGYDMVPVPAGEKKAETPAA